jgi:amidase
MLLHDDPAHAFMPYPPVPVPGAGTGPLSGLTFGVKDLFDVAGYPTGAGQPMMLALSGIKTRTAPTVQRMLDAGARFVGKTHTDELAFSMNGQNAHFGTPRNGAAPDRIPGGSSNGSASAVSNDLCDTALGTDTGGSVRAPASHCGLWGLRPTHGRISLHGAHDLSPSFDTCGFFARDLGTFARVADILLGDDAQETADLGRHPRLLMPTDAWALVGPEVRDAHAAALTRIQNALGPASSCALALQDFPTMAEHFRILQGREAWTTDGSFITRHAPVLGPGVVDRFMWASTLTDAQVAASHGFRVQFRAHLNALLGKDGVLVLPTMPDIAPLLTTSAEDLQDYRTAAMRLLCSAGLAGAAQLNLPLSSRLGAPLGLSLLGPAGSDRSLVRLAERILSA